MTPLAVGGSRPLISSCSIDVTECSRARTKGRHNRERKLRKMRGRGEKVPWCIWIDKCLFWLLRMELNCGSEETSKHNSGLTSSGRGRRGRRGGSWHCTQAALQLSCWLKRTFSHWGINNQWFYSDAISEHSGTLDIRKPNHFLLVFSPFCAAFLWHISIHI